MLLEFPLCLGTSIHSTQLPLNPHQWTGGSDEEYDSYPALTIYLDLGNTVRSTAPPWMLGISGEPAPE